MINVSVMSIIDPWYVRALGAAVKKKKDKVNLEATLSPPVWVNLPFRLDIFQEEISLLESMHVRRWMEANTDTTDWIAYESWDKELTRE